MKTVRPTNFLKENHKSQLKKKTKCFVSIGDTEETLQTADKITFRPKHISTEVNFQKSPKSEAFPNKHKLRAAGGKYVSGSCIGRRRKKGLMAENPITLRKLESKEEDVDLDG